MRVKKYYFKLSVVILALVMFVIFTSSVFALSPYDEESVKYEITYITEDFSLEQTDVDIKLVSPAEINKIKQTDTLWVDGHIAKNPEVKNKIKQVFEMGGRIIILDSESKLSDIYEIFDKDQSIIIRESEKTAQEEIVEEFPEDATPLNRVGYVIINEKGYKHIITLNVEHTDLIIRTCKYASMYNYLDFVLGTASISNFKEENDIKSDWGWGWGNWLDSNTNTDSYTYLTVTESISLQENANNPQSGKYLYYVPYRIDVDPVGTLRSLHRVDITTSGGTTNTPKIIDYGPLNSTTGTALFNLTFKGTISFPIGMNTKISRISGGLDSTNVIHRYQPWVIGPTFTYSSMRAEGHIMVTRTGEFLYGTGRYSVRIGLGALHTHTYTSSASLIVSAYSNN